MRLVLDGEAWEDYLYWQETDRRLLKKLNTLIAATLRDPFEGIGKPEPLRYSADGAWSRRIDGEHRFVYLVKDDTLVVLQARHHY